MLLPPGTPPGAPWPRRPRYPVTSPVCRIGTVVPAPEVGIPLPGTHRLLGPRGEVVATLFSHTVNLNRYSGRPAVVCGRNAGVVEGVQAIDVRSAQPLFHSPAPLPRPFD
ncbi:MAG: hypothetical protein DIU70_013340 [Bacillota bacterium]|nr:MAG: hypothetical protein DIU70_12540 [Bacillota bacterium]